ncbi:MAG: RNA pyrophosphohydrolase, partial [Alphaproteobacteria bacterium]
YDLSPKFIPYLWNGQYKGQKQKWFLINFLGSDQDIDLKKNSNPEFYKWRWIHVAELTRIVVPFKRKLYKAVIREFRNFFT